MLTTPPFRRAPWLLFRRPILLVAVAGTSLILGMVASLTPLFGSSASSAALQRQLEGRCQSSFAATMPTVASFGPGMASDLAENREVLRSATAGDPVFEDPILLLRGIEVAMTGPAADGETAETKLIGMEGFREHLDLVDGAHGDGAYIDERTASTLDVGAGDEVQITVEVFDFETHESGDLVVPLQVTAVYRDLYGEYFDPYWCVLEEDLAPSPFGDLPPAPVLVDSEMFQDDPEVFATLYGLGHDGWQVPIRIDGLTVTDAYRAAETIVALDEDIEGRLSGLLDEHLDDLDLGVESDLLLVTDRVRAQATALQTSVFPLAAVVLLASIGLLGAAGSYWVERRRAELELLSAVGVPPTALALKAALELLLPVLVGSLLGWGVGNLIIGLVGPSPDIESQARGQGMSATLLAAGAGLLVAALVAGIRSRRLLDRGTVPDRELRLRWPLIVLSFVAAYMVRARIGDQAVTVGEGVVVGSVDPLALLFPVLVLIGTVLLISELLTLAGPSISRLGGGRSHSRFIASRRVLSAPAIAMALLAGTAVPVAILVYSAGLARSATVSIEAKGKTSIGSDVSTLVYRVEPLPPALDANSTVVMKFERVDLEGTTVDVLAVDPETFAGGAFWLDTFADRPLEQVLADLETAPGSGALSAVVANTPVESGGVVQSDAGPFEIDVVGTIAAFPGAVRDRPLVIVDSGQLHDVLAADQERIRGGRYSIWTRGLDETEVDELLEEAGISFAFSTAADTTLDQLKFAVIVWTFEFLRLYAALAGLIVIASVLIYTDTRQRARNLSYALARRMGLTRSDHAMAGFLEVGSLTLLGALAGIVVGRWSSRDLYLALDPLPDTPPSPQWVGTSDLGVLIVVVTLAVAGLSAWMAQRTADNADVSELLRHGD